MSGCHNPFVDKEDRCKCVHCLDERIKSLEKEEIKLRKTINELVDKIADIANYYYREKKQPYRCPICEGTSFIISKLHFGPCNSCDGKGIIWN